MQPKTEELLYFLLWSAEKLMQPTYRNLTESFEGWAYRNGLLRQLGTLQKQRFIERKEDSPGERIYRLTEQGRLHALGGRDPVAQWSRGWDGVWRLVLYDLPVAHNAQRARLRRYLCTRGFGFLQNSVWISPDPLEEELRLFAGVESEVEKLIVLEAKPCAGESDAEIVSASWDFARINRRYEQYLHLLEQKLRGTLAKKSEANKLRRWATAERTAWRHAVDFDPLLPAKLLPPDYLGRRAWERRVEVLREAGRSLQRFVA